MLSGVSYSAGESGRLPKDQRLEITIGPRSHPDDSAVGISSGGMNNAAVSVPIGSQILRGCTTFQLEGQDFKQLLTPTLQHVFKGNWTCSFVRRSSVQGAVKLRIWH